MNGFEISFWCKEHNRRVSHYGGGLNPEGSGHATFYCDWADLYCVPPDFDGENEIGRCQEHWYSKGPFEYVG